MKKFIRIISFAFALLIVVGAVVYFGALLQDARLDNREGHLLCGYYDTTDPHDVIFNALPLGKSIYARLDSVSKSILEIAAKDGYSTKNVKQGYAKVRTQILQHIA